MADASRRARDGLARASIAADAAGTAIAVTLATLAAFGYAAASIFRHDRFGSNAYDLGLYDQIVWGYSRFDVAVPHTISGAQTLIGGHFQPLLFLLAPVYWVWADPRALLIVQAACLGSASLPLYVWAREQLGVSAAILFQVAYLAFWGVLGGNLFDFHATSFAVPIIAVALYSLLTRRTWLLVAAVVLGLLVRENIALTLAAIGIYAAVVQRRWRLGGAIVAVSVAWFLIVIKAVLPAISGRSYEHWYYGQLGSGPGGALVKLVTDPIDSVRIFFTPHVKRVALFNLFAAWLFLPLVSPLVIVMLPPLGERFFADRPELWAQGFHYSLVLAPILAFAAVDTTARVARHVDTRRARAVGLGLGAAVLAAGLFFSFVRLRPLDELGRYTSAAHSADVQTCLGAIPSDASVAATSALVPHLSRRRRIYLLDRRPIPRTDYLAIDTFTWRFPLTLDDIGRIVVRAFADGYGVVCSRPGTVVLREGGSNRRLNPELARQLGR